MNIVSTTFWSAVRNWGVRLGSVLVFFVMARVLTKDQLGLVSATIAILAFLEIVSENGLGDALVQSQALSDAKARAALWYNVAFGLAVAVVLVLLAPALEGYFATPGLAAVLPVLAVTLLFNGLSYIPQSLFRRRFEYKWLAIRSLVATLVSGAIGIAMALTGFGAWSMVAQAVLFAAISTAMVWARPPVSPRGPADFGGLGPMLRFGWSITVGRILYYVSVRAVELVLLYRFGAATLSLYIMGSRIFFVLTQMLLSVLVDVSFSAFSRMADDRPRLTESLLSSFRFGSAVTVPIFLGLSAVAPELTRVAFGDKGPEAAPYLVVIALIGVLQMPRNLFASVISATGRARTTSVVTGVQAVLTALILLVPWGATPLMLVTASSATNLVAMPVMAAIMARAGVADLRSLVRVAWRPHLAGALMWLLLFAVRRGAMPLTGSPLVDGGLLVAIGAGIYALLLYMLDPGLVRQLARVGLRRRGKASA